MPRHSIRSDAFVLLGFLVVLAGCGRDSDSHSEGARVDACTKHEISQVRGLLGGHVRPVQGLAGECRFRLEYPVELGQGTLEVVLRPLPAGSVAETRPERLAVEIASAFGKTEPPLYAGRIDGHYLYRQDTDRRLIRALVLSDLPNGRHRPDSLQMIAARLSGTEPFSEQQGRELEARVARLAHSLRRFDD